MRTFVNKSSNGDFTKTSSVNVTAFVKRVPNYELREKKTTDDFTNKLSKNDFREEYLTLGVFRENSQHVTTS